MHCSISVLCAVYSFQKYTACTYRIVKNYNAQTKRADFIPSPKTNINKQELFCLPVPTHLSMNNFLMPHSSASVGNCTLFLSCDFKWNLRAIIYEVSRPFICVLTCQSRRMKAGSRRVRVDYTASQPARP
jgi:hypothetical protein